MKSFFVCYIIVWASVRKATKYIGIKEAIARITQTGFKIFRDFSPIDMLCKQSQRQSKQDRYQ